jgi:hypothetical protein
MPLACDQFAASHKEALTGSHLAGKFELPTSDQSATPKGGVMGKAYLLAIVAGGALLGNAVAAGAAPVARQSESRAAMAQPSQPGTEAQPGIEGQPGAQEALPPPATPKPKKTTSFFGLPLLALVAAGGGIGAAAAASSDETPASP